MKVCHISLVGYPYISSWGYQENHLIDVHHKMGHDVSEITMMYIPKTYKGYINENEDNYKESFFIDSDGTKIFRVHLAIPISDFRYYKNISSILEQICPDVIFVHDLHFFSLYDITKYIKKHPNCILKGDIHATFANSCKNFISKNILHKIIYRFVINRNIQYFQKIYYLTEGAKEFFCSLYNVDRDCEKLEFLPLGGFIISDKEYKKIRINKRRELGVNPNTFLILHSGKLEKEKKTHELIEEFKSVDNPNVRLYIAGAIPNSQYDLLVNDINSDPRIFYLGWIPADDLRDLMCSADLYIQPGTESSSLQTAMCCRCPCAVNFHKDDIGGGYSSFLTDQDVFSLEKPGDIKKAIETISIDDQKKRILSKRALIKAHELFDYTKQVERIIHDDRI